ncbi:hypothetical protein AB1Y20_002874 [Prymnesium parvum]|uniref:Fe2OG dioxygenase domain-containing protein n=1 Tax=Prymnesium parvum TaxID=97485 RepID=A0AB34JAD6_PRYPA
MALDFNALLAAERTRRRHGGAAPASASEAAGRSPAPPPAPCRSPPPPAVGEYCLPERQRRAAMSEAHRIQGEVQAVFHVADWMDEGEEQGLLRCINSIPDDCWVQLRSRRLLQLGGTPLPQGMQPEPLPSWASAVCDALVAAGVFSAEEPPNHVLVNEYLPGQGIAAHRDGPLYLSRVAIVSMGSHCTFQFVSDDVERRPHLQTLLPRRGLLVFEGDAYEKLLHEVVAQHADLPPQHHPSIRQQDASEYPPDSGLAQTPSKEEPGMATTERIPRERRVSLTVRRVLRVLS